MRVVFMGTPSLSATVLEGIAACHDVVGVFTRPDAVRGRGKKLVASPVKQVALGLGIPVFTPDSMSDGDAVQVLRQLAPDVACVAAYGMLLPREVLEIPTIGCLNVHTSLLPRWRGAAPMQRAILAGDSETGVCIMRMEEGLDTGAYCKRIAVPVDQLYLSDLEAELARLGSSALVEALRDISAGTATWTEQDGCEATYATKIGKGELALSENDTVALACAKVRASDAAHPARALFAGRGVTIERASIAGDEQAIGLCESLECGDFAFRSKRLFAQCADGAIEIEQVKPDGRKSMDARSFAGGIQGIKGNTLQWGSC